MEGRSGKEGGIDLATKPVPPRPVPRLYLATPVVDDPSPLMASLPGLLAGADVAAVLVRLRPTDQRTMISRVKALAPAIQDSGAALLLDGHVELVARAGADGAHLTGIEAMEEALPTLKPDRIAGVGGLTTRHDSMAAPVRTQASCPEPSFPARHCIVLRVCGSVRGGSGRSRSRARAQTDWPIGTARRLSGAGPIACRSVPPVRLRRSAPAGP